MEILITLAIILFSVIVHEISHGLVAEKFGDSTARDEGRITLNPIPHIDPFASILLPAFLLYVHSPVLFGAAKPVPVNFENLSPKRLGMIMVSLAGPLSNFVLAVLCILPVTFNLVSGTVGEIWIQAALTNVALGVFNLLPIPPLDGSKVIAAFLPETLMYKLLEFERFGFILIVIFLYLGVLGKLLLPAFEFFLKIFGLY